MEKERYRDPVLEWNPRFIQDWGFHPYPDVGMKGKLTDLAIGGPEHFVTSINTTLPPGHYPVDVIRETPDKLYLRTREHPRYIDSKQFAGRVIVAQKWRNGNGKTDRSDESRGARAFE